MLNPILIFSLTASLLSILFITLSLMVISRRRETKIGFKDGQDAVLLRRVRAHANFVEYVPLTFILMGLSLLLQISPHVFAVVALVFLIGRFVHAIGILGDNVNRQVKGRILGMLLTLFPMLYLAIFLLVKAIMIVVITTNA